MSIRSRALNRLEKVAVKVVGDPDRRPRPPVGDAEPAGRGAVDREFNELVELIELKLEHEARAAAEEAAREEVADEAAAAGDDGGDDLCRLVEALEEQTTGTGGDIAGDESSDNGPADVGDTGMEA